MSGTQGRPVCLDNMIKCYRFDVINVYLYHYIEVLSPLILLLVIAQLGESYIIVVDWILILRIINRRALYQLQIHPYHRLFCGTNLWTTFTIGFPVGGNWVFKFYLWYCWKVFLVSDMMTIDSGMSLNRTEWTSFNHFPKGLGSWCRFYFSDYHFDSFTAQLLATLYMNSSFKIPESVRGVVLKTSQKWLIPKWS